MTKLYRIKPLVWEETPMKTGVKSETPIGITFSVIKPYGVWLWCPSNRDFQNCDSLEDGKAKCNAHYVAFLEQALEEVPETETIRGTVEP